MPEKIIVKLEVAVKIKCVDTFCITCGRKNCPKLPKCPRQDLED